MTKKQDVKNKQGNRNFKVQDARKEQRMIREHKRGGRIQVWEETTRGEERTRKQEGIRRKKGIGNDK